MFKKGDIVQLISKFNLVGFFKVRSLVNQKVTLEGLPAMYFRQDELVAGSQEDYESQIYARVQYLESTVAMANKMLSRMYPNFDLARTSDLLKMFDYNQEALIYSCAIMETLETKPFWIEMYEIQDL